MYGIYHLLRPARGRTPASSGSYHFFSLFMDTGIIPFYVFIVLLANQEYNMDPSSQDRWTSLFTSENSTNLLMFITYIGGMVLSGLHFVSIGLDLYLIVMFRRIARLPPDMNPLEDNLTRRPSNKHKHKNSEMSASTESFSEKKLGYYSGSSICTDDQSRLSTAKSPEARVMPFGHSRLGSNTNFSAHSPDTARLSRQQFAAAGLYDNQPSGGRYSRQSGGSPNRYSRAGSHSPSKHASLYESLNDAAAQLDARDPLASPEMPDHAQFINPAKKRKPMQNLAAAAMSSPPRNEPSANWVAYEDNDENNEGDMGTPSRRRNNEPAPAYSRLPMHERHDSFEPNPLKMNPPTPVNAPDHADNNNNNNHNHNHPMNNYHPQPSNLNDNYHPADLPNSPETVRASRFSPQQQQQQPQSPPTTRYSPAPAPEHDSERTMTMESRTSTIQASSIYSDDVPSIRSGSKVNPATPKGKYYGDLAAATRGVLRSGANSPFGRPTAAVQSPHYQQQQYQQQQLQSPPSSHAHASPRVISRTGVDITDAAMGRFDSDANTTFGGVGTRRREVSGKVAEEGRGGGGWHSRG